MNVPDPPEAICPHCQSENVDALLRAGTAEWYLQCFDCHTKTPPQPSSRKCGEQDGSSRLSASGTRHLCICNLPTDHDGQAHRFLGLGAVV